MSGRVHDPAQLGQHPAAEPRPVLLDEQIARAGEEHAKAAGALVRVEEQPADLARPFQVGAQGQGLVAEDAPELLALLRQGRDTVAVEGPVAADLAENLAGAADRAAVEILEHEEIEVVRLALAVAAEALGGALEL